MMLATIVVDCQNALGEGPVWDHINEQLIWVDYNRGKVCTFNEGSGKYASISVADTAMVVIPTDRKNWILAIDKNVCIYDVRTNQVIKQVTVEEDKPENRLNDGKCDAKGRLWVGTMGNAADTPAGALYKVNAGFTYEKMDEPFIIPNGIAWNKENTVMYVVDSMKQKIFRYDFDLEKGTITNKAVLIDTSAEQGFPDGMTIDEEDNLWVAFWQGQSVLRYDTRTGKVLTHIHVPAFIPSSCCFGGKHLDTLYITSSRNYDTAENIRKFPLAGGLFRFSPGVKGMPTVFFKER